MADSGDKQGSTDEIVESIIQYLHTRLTDAKAEEKDLPREEMQKSVDVMNEIKGFLLKNPQHSASALVRTVLKGILKDLDEKANVQETGSKDKLARLVKNVPKLKTQLEVDPEAVKHSMIPELHESIIPAVLDRLELVDNYKHPNQERRVSEQVQKLKNDLQSIRSWIQLLQEKKYDFKDAGDIASALVENSYIDDLDTGKLYEKLDLLTKFVVKLKQRIHNTIWESIIEDLRIGLNDDKAKDKDEDKDKDKPKKEMATWEKDLDEIKDILLKHSDHSACALVMAVLEGIHQDLGKKADDQAAKLNRLKKNVRKLKTQLEVDPEDVKHSNIPKLHKFIIPAVVDRLELAENYKKPLDPEIPSSQKVSDQVHKLTNDLQYIGILIKQLQENKDNLDKELEDFQGKVGEIANALIQHSYIDDLKADKLQEKLEILTKLVVKLKQQISSRNQLSRTGPDSNPYTQVGEEIASAQANKILPVLHLYSSLHETPTFKDFREVYEGLKPREKMCLLYFALIPENEIVKKRFMTYWWVGEGLVGEGLHKGTYEDIGNEILKTLLERGCIEPENKEHRPAAGNYKMNPFIRSAVIKLAEEAKFCALDSKGNLTAISPFKNLVCLVDGFSKVILDEGSVWPLEKLQTIFNVNEPYPDVFKLEWFPKMKNVKALYLGRWQTSPKHHIEVESTDFLQGLKNMKLLRFLSLQGMSNITQLPHFVGGLLNLRILDLRACHNLENLPDEIGKLKRLTHLDLSECYLLERMPKGIASLKRLQVLKGFVVRSMPSGKDRTRKGKSKPKPSRKYCSLQDLSALKKLRKLSIYTNSYNFPNDPDVNAFCKFEMLQKLTITWGAGEIPKNGGNSHLQDKGEAKPAAEKISGENQKQDENPAKPIVGTASSPKNGGDIQKQDEGEIQPNASANTCPKNDGDGHKKDESPVQPKNSGDSQKRDNVEVPPPAVTIPSPKSGGNIQKKDNGAAQQSGVTITSPENSEDRFRKLVKLELKCYPRRTAPRWLQPKQLPKLEKLYIRGGELHNLNSVKENEKWKVKTLRLKFLRDLKLDWKTIESSFPELDYLEAFECPKLTFLPFNENGVLNP